MLKMFTTQLTGLFQRINNKEEEMLEDASRLLAQAQAGEGKMYIKGFKEMGAIILEATEGAEAANYFHPLQQNSALESMDRVILFTRSSIDSDAISFAQELADANIPFVAVAGKVKDAENDLADLTDVFVDTQLIRSLLPTEDGSRIGFPSAIAGLYIYHIIKFTLDEIFDEFDL